MKTLKMTLIGVLSIFLVACSSSQIFRDTRVTKENRSVSLDQRKEGKSMENSKIVFINASRNKDGNTVKMAEKLLEGMEYDQINLIDYTIAFLGQENERDDFQTLLKELEGAKTIVIGTPVYWHSMSGSLKTMIDRLYELQDSDYSLEGKNLYFFMQGSAPTDLAIESTEYIIERVAAQTGMNLVGVADNDEEINALHEQLLAR